MADTTNASRWTRHFFYRSEQTRTTWKLRLGAAAVAVGALWLTSGWWTAAIGRSLVCEPAVAPSDAILIENFDADYVLFRRAAELRRAGIAARVLVPVSMDPGTANPNAVSLGIAEVMTRLSQLGRIEIVPVRQIEPITINAVRDVHRYLGRERIRSLVVVTPLFRSRRSALVYGATLGQAGIALHFQTVPAARDLSAWAHSWHGVQEVGEQWLKLQYYRLWVLPFM